MDKLIKRKGSYVHLAIAEDLPKSEQVIEGSKEVLEGLYATWVKLAEYEELGSVDELRKLKEKQIPLLMTRGSMEESYACPSCHEDRYWKDGQYCKDCGQRLDWSYRT